MIGSGAGPRMATGGGGLARWVGGVFPDNGNKVTLASRGARAGHTAIMAVVTGPAAIPAGWKMIEMPADPNNPGAPTTKLAWKRLAESDLGLQWGGNSEDWTPPQAIHVYSGSIGNIVGRSYGVQRTSGINHDNFTVPALGFPKGAGHLGLGFFVRTYDFGARGYLTAPAATLRGNIHMRGAVIDDGLAHDSWMHCYDRLVADMAPYPDNAGISAVSEYSTFCEVLTVEFTS